MSLKHKNDVITFDVNETLYFEKGQEIDEMVSISLDPEIAIQSYDNYIQVRGLIILQGEYIKAEDRSDDGNTYNDAELTGYIEKVIDTEENQAQFSHRFPVEISVPPYRVENLEDVTVSIDSFDYELPNPGKLKIKSSIHINGIKADVAIEEKSNVEYDDVVGGSQERQEEISEAEVKETAQAPEVVEHVEEKIEMVEEIIQTADENHLEALEIKEKETNDIDIQLNENEEAGNEEVKDVLFLTELFGSEEEESHTKVRLYITQEEDTVESIAKRYELSALQLIKDNNLSGESIEEGQLLKLPAQTEK